MTRLTRFLWLNLIALIIVASPSQATAAQAAQITALILSVEHSLTPSGKFSKSKVGTMLMAGSHVRTGKRSKCEIRFPDGSIVRMGPSSDLVLQTVATRNLKLQGGQLFAKFVSGNGARIQGGSAVAAIKGTTLEYSTTLNRDGTYTDTCVVHETTHGVDFITAAGIRTLLGGFGSSWTDRTPPLTDADPAAGAQDPAAGAQDPAAGAQDPAAGAPDPAAGAGAPAAGAQDPAAGTQGPAAGPQDPGAGAPAAGAPAATGGAPTSTAPRSSAPPAAVAQPPQQFSGGRYTAPFSGVQAGGSVKSTPGTQTTVETIQNSYVAIEVVNNVLPGTQGKDEGDLAIVVQSLSLPPAQVLSLPAQSLTYLPQVATALYAALGQKEPVPRELFGKRFFGPYLNTDVFALWGNPDSVAGFRVRPSAVLADWYFEVGAAVTHNFNGSLQGRLTEAFAAVRPRKSELTIGRQHFLSGPVINSDLGTVIGFDTYDAVRYQRQIGTHGKADLALVLDFAPYAKESISGYVVRGERTVAKGIVGGNWVHENGRGTASSIDFTLPALPGVIDLYGEFGNNTDDAKVQTYGLYLPSLYEAHDIDVFIERARRSGKPSLLSMVAYRKIMDNVTGVMILNKESGNSLKLSLGGLYEF
jgi:hypothetical protein